MKKKALWLEAFPDQIKAAPFRRLIAKPGKPKFIRRPRTAFEADVNQMLRGPRRSKKRASAIHSIRMDRVREYNRLKRAWLKGRACAKCGTHDNVDLRHSRGRLGALPSEQRFWIPLCQLGCHRWVHDHPAAARLVQVLVDGQWLPLLCAKGEWNKP